MIFRKANNIDAEADGANAFSVGGVRYVAYSDIAHAARRGWWRVRSGEWKKIASLEWDHLNNLATFLDRRRRETFSVTMREEIGAVLSIVCKEIDKREGRPIASDVCPHCQQSEDFYYDDDLPFCE
jgi:hypothetical protein